MFIISIITLLFGAYSISDASTLLQNAYNFEEGRPLIRIILNNNNHLFGIALVIFLYIIEYLHNKYNLVYQVKRLNIVLRLVLYAIAIYFTIIFGVFEEQEFIYFQF